MIIGRRRCVWLTQRPAVRRMTCCSWYGSSLPSLTRRRQRVLDQRPQVVEDAVVLDEAAGVDLRAGDDLARRRSRSRPSR